MAWWECWSAGTHRSGSDEQLSSHPKPARNTGSRVPSGLLEHSRLWLTKPSGAILICHMDGTLPTQFPADITNEISKPFFTQCPEYPESEQVNQIWHSWKQLLMDGLNEAFLQFLGFPLQKDCSPAYRGWDPQDNKKTSWFLNLNIISDIDKPGCHSPWNCPQKYRHQVYRRGSSQQVQPHYNCHSNVVKLSYMPNWESMKGSC